MNLASIVEASNRVEAKLSMLYARFRVRTSRIPARYVDGFWTVFTYVLGSAAMFFGGDSPPERNVGAWAYIIGVAIAAPLYFRRRFPLRVFIACAAMAFVYQYVEKPNELEAFQAFPLIVAAYCIGSYRERWRSIVIALIAVTPVLALANHHNNGDPGTTSRYPWIGSLIIFACAVAIGVAVGNRRQAMESLKERARLAELSREDEARRMVDEERLRIARELHDVVAHSIVTISVQAGVAAHVFESQPEQARAAIGEIRKLSKETLQELRTTLGFLRAADNDVELRTPAPGLAQIDALIERMRAAGLRIRLNRAGDPRPLPAAVDLVAFRILQEALTNVVKHVGPTIVEVNLTYERDRFEILVTDDGPGVEPVTAIADGTKHGLLGMRERAAAVGGTFSAGPREGGGFEVCATLPIGGVG